MRPLAKPKAVFEPASPEGASFAADVIAGLTAMPKRIPPKHFYDNEGSLLFEEITRTPEYYPTRSELEILRTHAAAMAALIPEGTTLVEFGSGASTKVRYLLDAAPQLAAYIPIDISGDFLEQEAAVLRRDYPDLKIEPVAADFTKPFGMAAADGKPRVGFFPGSTIGNFEPHEACAFLRNAAGMLGKGALLIVGVDLIKDQDILHAAYNDAAGVTEKFNLNLLTRMNRELNADFKLDTFEHHAFYNRERQRIEMHLASLKRQKVRVAGTTVEFRLGETIHTENSYKFSPESFGALARGANWSPAAMWTDSRNNFSVHALRLM